MVSLSPLLQLELHSPGSESLDLPTFVTSSVMDQVHLSTDGQTSSKRLSSDNVMMPPKRVCLQPCSTSLPVVEQLSRQQQQEEEDHRLALLLQKELDQEERRDVDRRKGSTDAYSLRLNHHSVTSSSSTTRKTSSAPKESSKTTSRLKASSTTPYSPSLCKGRKQATLTEMFSSFNTWCLQTFMSHIKLSQRLFHCRQVRSLVRIILKTGFVPLAASHQRVLPL